MTGRNPATWNSATWLAMVTEWIDEALAAAGRRRIGDVQRTRVRPWGAVLRIVTDDGIGWFKAGSKQTAFEAGLYEVLAARAPRQVLVPIAVDAARGWVLLPDGGPSLRESGDSHPSAPEFAAALRTYAQLQIALGAAVDQMVAIGVADMRPARLLDRFDEALARTARHARDSGRQADHDDVAALRSRVEQWAGELIASPIPPSVDHNDLHAGNMLVSSGGARFYDWGDSVVAHPFASMLVPFTAAQGTLGCDDRDPRLRALIDAYLRPFGDARGVEVAELTGDLRLACHLAKIARALVWQRALDSDPHLGATWADAPLNTLCSLLHASPFGDA